MAGVIEERFAAFLRPGYFSRVDNQHPLELYIGLDEKGRKAIELRARFTARKVTGTSAIDVNQYKNEKYSTIRFSLCDEEIKGIVLQNFCDDLIEQSRGISDKGQGYQTIVNRFFQWKEIICGFQNMYSLQNPKSWG